MIPIVLDLPVILHVIITSAHDLKPLCRKVFGKLAELSDTGQPHGEDCKCLYIDGGRVDQSDRLLPAGRYYACHTQATPLDSLKWAGLKSSGRIVSS